MSELTIFLIWLVGYVVSVTVYAAYAGWQHKRNPYAGHGDEGLMVMYALLAWPAVIPLGLICLFAAGVYTVVYSLTPEGK